MADLSVILIGRNQEWNIARLIESVLEHTAAMPSREVVYVDSASTDRTVEIAQNYPIGIIQLSPDQPLSAAAGRYIGYQQTTGQFVMFLDGDMEMWPGWLETAMTVLEQQPDVAGITGQFIDLPVDATADDWHGPDASSFGMDYEEIKQTGGASLFRRAVLDEVGPFNPFIVSDEEPEMCLRVRQHGYRLLRLNRPMVFHYSTPVYAISTLFARRKRNLYIGFGQVMRYHLGDEYFMPYLKERGFVVLPGIALLVGLLSLLLSIIRRNPWWAVGYIALILLVVALDAVRKRSLHRAIHALVQRIVLFEGTVKGFFRPPNHPEAYPGKHTVIQPVRDLKNVEVNTSQ